MHITLCLDEEISWLSVCRLKLRRSTENMTY